MDMSAGTNLAAGGTLRRANPEATELNTWTVRAAWALGGVAVFSSMHLADELWSRWDIGATQVADSAIAGAVIAIPTALTLLALAAMLRARRWGLWLAIGIGVYSLWPPLTHVLDPHEMTAFRWGVEGLAAVSSVVLIAAAAMALRRRLAS
jgi:uncharacterized membrane protein YecN with MAPEG domain